MIQIFWTHIKYIAWIQKVFVQAEDISSLVVYDRNHYFDLGPIPKLKTQIDRYF